MEKSFNVRTVYLYLFSLLGLVLMVIGSVNFIDMGLKAYVFTKADEYDRQFSKMPPISVPAVEKYNALPQAQKTQQTTYVQLTADEKSEMNNFLANYKSWQETQKNIDPITSQRQREASTNLALMLVGLPLYLYHWMVIRRENKPILVAKKTNGKSL